MIFRYVQDGDPYYGNAVRVFQVDVLTTTDYQEHEVLDHPVLKASGSGWNSLGMHHIDPHQLDDMSWIACVDGKGRKVDFDLKIGAERFMHETKQLAKKAADHLHLW